MFLLIHAITAIWMAVDTIPTPVEWYQPLIQTGSNTVILAPVVVWLMVRVEKLLEKGRVASERGTHALMVAILSIKHLDEGIRELATKIRDDAKDAIPAKE